MQNRNRLSRNGMSKVFLLLFLLISLVIAVGIYLTFFIKKMKKPELTFKSLELQNATFETVDLLATLGIQNPNPISVSLNGFEYEVRFEGKSLFQGRQDKKIPIQAHAESPLNIPIHVFYKNIYDAFKNYESKEEASFEVMINVFFELPVLGTITLPATKTGSLPLLKMPSIKDVSLKKKKVEMLKGVELELTLQLENPNKISFEMAQFQYTFSVAEQPWITGQRLESTSFAPGDQNFLIIPIDLSIAKMGQSVLGIATGGKSLQYVFEGSLVLKTKIPILPSLTWNFKKEGQTSVK